MFLRLAAGSALAWWILPALPAPEVGVAGVFAAAAVFVLTLWRAGPGLIVAAALAPAGALLAPEPVGAAELVAWCCLAGWLLAVWRPLSPTGWPRMLATPAVLYVAALGASWLGLTLGDAAGIAPAALPQFLLQSIPRDHLIFSSPEAETWTLLQGAAGVGIFLAAVAITRDDARTVRGLAWALVASAAVLAVVSVADIVRQWAAVGYEAWFLQRYVEGERESVAFADLNAAGSMYALAGLIAASLAAFDAPRRILWVGLLVLMLPAVWLAGSLSAVLSAIVVALMLGAALGPHRWQPTRRQAIAAAAVFGIAVATSALIAAQRGEGRATMGEALQLRAQFVETSARMFASAPVFGVGVGRYFDRSAEYMPPPLRARYGNENAHNYVLQEFAELGVVGGALFLWLVAAGLWRGWRGVRSSQAGDGALMGLFAGASAYLLTCTTGHPLLVPGAALPFWAAFGALAATGSRTEANGLRPTPLVVPAILLLLAVGTGATVWTAARQAGPPAERGFHGLEIAEDGTRFRWMTRHAVTYIPDTPGFLTLRLRSPDDRAGVHLLHVQVAIAGRVADVVELTEEGWVTVELGVRDSVPADYRRVDLRANQQWTEEVMLGNRPVQRPISAMVGEIVWTGANAVR